MGASLLLHLVTAYFSVGYHSADEYFQITEFVSAKMGWAPPQHLAVEFHEKMRPWLQPLIYWVMTKAWLLMGVKSPFTWAFSFRLISGLAGWVSLVCIGRCIPIWFKDPRAQRFAIRALALMWFLPALQVRPSSESLGGSFFLMGAGLFLWLSQQPLLRPRAWSWWLCGALLGMSFEFRYQMGGMVAGLGLWAMIASALRSRGNPFGVTTALKTRQILEVALGLLIMLGMGRWADFMGYGQWVLSPWRYIDYNLIRGEVNRFGQAPWWDVFRMSFTESWPFIGLALAIASLVGWIRHPRHPLTWAGIPFFAMHEAIAHKELRFFFPLAMHGPILLTLALTSARSGKFFEWPKLRVPRIALKTIWGFLLANNALALVALLFLPSSRNVQFYEGLASHIPPGAQRFDLYHHEGRDPYLVLGNPVFFYRPPELVTHAFKNYSEVAERMIQTPGQPTWLFNLNFDLPPEAASIAPHCTAVYRTLPPWVKMFNYNDWLSRTSTWTLFRCERS